MRRSSVALLRPAMLGLLLIAVSAVPAAGVSGRAPSSASPTAAAPGAGLTNRPIITHGSGNRTANDRRPARRVIVNQLPKNAHPAPAYQPQLRPATTTTAGSASPSVNVLDEVPTQATVTTTNPVVEAVSGAGTGDPAGVFGVEPPDPWVAVGPDTVVQSTNVGLRMTDRSLGTVLDVPLQDFFGITQIPGDYDAVSFDPRVVYDSLHGRWVAIETSFDCYADPANGTNVGTGYLDLAVSDSADLRLGWSIISIPFSDAIPDYPGLGTSTDKVVLSSNLFELVANTDPLPINCGFASPAPLLGTEIDVLGWAQLIGTGALDLAYWTSLDPNPIIAASDFTFRPAVQMPAATTTVHGIVRRIGGSVGHFKVTGLPSATTTLSITTLAQTTIDGFSASPPDPIQPGPTTISMAVDGRPTDAIWQNNRLIFTSTFACDPTGGAVETRDCVRVSELNTATPTPTVAQDFLIAEDGADNFMAGIGLSGNSDLHVVWTRSSATAGDFPSTYAAYQLKGASASSLTGKVKISAGTSVYSGTRWGDYVGVAQDPQVADAVWSADEYATDGGDWATEVSQLRTFGGASYHPITPQRTLDTRGVGIGLAGVFVANTARSFSVAGVGVVPSNAIAVTGNVTVVNQTAAGFVAVTPTLNSNPKSSTLNFPIGDVRANNFSLPLGPGGKLSAVYKAVAGKTTNLVVDITGYFVAGNAGATFHPLAVPARLIDSRPFGTGLVGPFQAGTPRTLVVTGLGGIPDGATAITGNLTVVGQTKAGYLSVTPDVPITTPPTSTLNFPLGDIRANGLTADLSDAGALSITYAAIAGATTNVILDVTGYYTDDTTGLLFYPLNPGRIMDSRGTILSGGVPAGILNANVYKVLDTDGHWGVPAGAAGITGNLTVVGQTQAGYLADTPTADVGISILNFPLGDIRANGITVPLGSGDQYFVYRAGGGQKTHAILDVTGYFK